MIQNVGYVKIISDITYHDENKGKAQQAVLIGCGDRPGTRHGGIEERQQRGMIVGMPTAATAVLMLLPAADDDDDDHH